MPLIMNCQLHAEAGTEGVTEEKKKKNKNSSEILAAAPLTLIWSEFQRDFFMSSEQFLVHFLTFK